MVMGDGVWKKEKQEITDELYNANKNKELAEVERFKKKFKKPVSLKALKGERSLAQMRLVQRGNRLSILPVVAKEWKHILKMAGEEWVI